MDATTRAARRTPPRERRAAGAGLTALKNRRFADVFAARVDGLTVSLEAIRAAYPRAKARPCVVHLLRAKLKYVTDKDSRPVASGLEAVCRAASAALAALSGFVEKWDGKYPTTSGQWRPRCAEFVAMVELPPAIPEAIYTTDAIESVNSTIRKFTRDLDHYPNTDSAVKLVRLAIGDAANRWTMPMVGWEQALNHFAILFEGRMPSKLLR